MQSATQDRSKFVSKPSKAAKHLGVVAAEAHHLAEAFVDGAEGAVAEFAVLDHEQRHAARGDAGHRPDRAEMMVRRELHATRSGERLGGGEVGRPAFEYDRTAHRPA